MSEKRYAIIIGINDYDTSPLDYCVNDASAISEILISRANFLKDNIYPILSDSENPVRDITGLLFNAISEIEKSFVKGKDSIFFYFAGHGFSTSEGSFLSLHESKLSITQIFSTVSQLNPKMQFYVIDACKSGSKTLTRGSEIPQNAVIEELIAASSGALFLYACQSDQNATEYSELQHGIMTHYFLEAIQTKSLYDEDEILTPGRIQEFVAKNVSKHSEFDQVPVMESRVVGYYPFIHEIKTLESDPPEQELELITYANVSELQRENIVKIPKNLRKELQKISIKLLDDKLSEYLTGRYNDYKKEKYDSIKLMPLSNNNLLIDRIGSEATGNYQAIDNVIYKQQKPIYAPKNEFNAMLAILNRTRTPIGFTDEFVIKNDSEYFDSINFLLTNESIRHVSFGIGAIAYQAKWGGVISPYYYKIDWDGQENSLIDKIVKYKYSYLIEESSITSILNINMTIFEDLQKDIEIWNRERVQELEQFQSST